MSIINYSESVLSFLKHKSDESRTLIILTAASSVLTCNHQINKASCFQVPLGASIQIKVNIKSEPNSILQISSLIFKNTSSDLSFFYFNFNLMVKYFFFSFWMSDHTCSSLETRFSERSSLLHPPPLPSKSISQQCDGRARVAF